ncbi:MAG: B12-binding domain-containing radical SAM protein [Deltaproteobacteria bacterium]|nr:B12-binding domain-containing radical SAM protein [Deltaproteobacteria bacterium]
MQLTLVYPCMGRIPGRRYVRSWQMEPLPAAHLAGLTPPDVEVRFFDDRMEPIDYGAATDLVAITAETCTAKRAYQIATEYRRRGVPVVMGGFHPTLVPDEAAQYAESIAIGEVEALWPRMLADFAAGRLQPVYRASGRPDISSTRPDRRIFAGKRYLPLSLVEASRGCPLACEFCSIQAAFQRSQTQRSIATIVDEIRGLRDRSKLFFFVDDSMVADKAWASELFRALLPLGVRWVSQATVAMAHDDDLLALMKRSGCNGVLIGFESLDEDNLRAMNKRFNAERGGAEFAVDRLHAAGIPLYATFVFGYERDTLATFEQVLDFCLRKRIFMVGFNHCTPFPGTPLYDRLRREGRLLYERWWLDDRYRYGQVPYRTSLPPDLIQRQCVALRKRFYGPRSILRRVANPANAPSAFMLRNYFFINALLRIEASQREDYPLGDLGFVGELLPARSADEAERLVRAS